jgi:exosortase A-associated hydrolase 1
MGGAMRRLLTFSCQGRSLAASLDGADGRIGVLMVTGGTQIRTGSHRMYERLAVALANGGYPCFRFDRRGVGDSEGTDPGFRGSAPDVGAALEAFRRECPGLEQVAGFGLCDGATALVLFGQELGLDTLILANPWFVETEENVPSPLAIRHHYRERLTSREGWRRLFTGRVSLSKAIRGLARIAAPSEASALARQVAEALEKAPPATLIVSRSDATGATAEALWNSRDFSSAKGRHPAPIPIASDSHTFAKTGDGDALAAACLTVLDGLGKTKAVSG